MSKRMPSGHIGLRAGHARASANREAGALLSVEQVEREPDPDEQPRIVAGILRPRHRPDETWERRQQGHLDAMRRGIGALHARGALRAGPDPDEVIAAFYALAGTDVCRALVCERGWTPERSEQWLFRLSCRELLGISEPEADARRDDR